MKKIGILFIISLILNCATRKEIVQFKDDTFTLRNQIEILRQENKEIQQMLNNLSQFINSSQEENIKTKADLLYEFEQLKTRSQIIESKLDDIYYYLPGSNQYPNIKKKTSAITSNASVPSSVSRRATAFLIISNNFFFIISQK